MQIIEQNAEYIEHGSLVHPLKFIERVGRTCYKSEAMITDESAERFVKNLIRNGHMAMLEHHTIHLKIQIPDFADYARFMQNMSAEKYLTISFFGDFLIVTGSYRALDESSLPQLLGINMEHFLRSETDIQSELVQEIDRQELIKIMGENKKECSKHIHHTVRFTTDRGISHEIVRHRNCAFAQESTRYVNYGKKGEIAVIKPEFESEDAKAWWLYSCRQAEKAYMDMIDAGVTPQMARSVLPTCLKTELVVTASEEEWQHIIDLRYKGTTGAPHPQVKELMEIILPTLEVKSEGRISGK